MTNHPNENHGRPNVKQWLESVGLGRYAESFAANEIDLEALPGLTEGMLERMGLPVGPRIKLLAALEGLRHATPITVPAQSPDAPVGERRQLTVLFCDIVGSTTLARSLDPEDLKILMQTYQQACREAIAAYDGHVAQYLGDGIMAYFGWPRAHEDDAERAVRAGLDLVRRIAGLDGVVPLQIRVGISTGVVVISETGDGDPAHPGGAIGATPHTAARLQSLAESGAVLVSESTRRLVNAYMDVEDLGQVPLKGFDAPVRVCRVLRVRSRSTRFLVANANSLTPFIDRQAEFSILRQRWEDAAEGDGQIVFVSGVPGIGKSRIVFELMQHARREPSDCLALQFSRHDAQSAFLPVIQEMNRRLGIRPGQHPEHRFARLQRYVGRALSNIEYGLSIIAHLLSITVPPRHAIPAISTQRLKDQTLAALTELLLALSRRRPVLLLMEDVQWIDPSSQELLDLIAARVDEARILVVATHRPEYRPRQEFKGSVSGFSLGRLPKSHAMRMVEYALPGHRGAALDNIFDRSERNPLFVEELSRAYLESIDPSNARSTRGTLEARVPDSVRDALMARLDRSDQARRVAQVASVLGREFDYELLRKVVEMPPDKLDAALDQLMRDEILFRIDRGHGIHYAFKHALLCDTAYDSLLRAHRREIHSRVCELIENDEQALAVIQPEMLAHHHAGAGHALDAAGFWLKGVEQARRKGANQEAIEQVQLALAQIATLPPSDEVDRMELQLRSALGLCLITIKGYASEDTRRPFERALELSERLHDPQKTVQSRFGLWGHYWMRGAHLRALELAHGLQEGAHRYSDASARVVALRCLGSTLFTQGRLIEARHELETAIELSRTHPQLEAAGTYPVSQRIAAQLMLAWDLWFLGQADDALELVTRTREESLGGRDPYSMAFSCYVMSAIHLLRGEAQSALRLAEESLEISTRNGINLYGLYSRFGRGCALELLGHAEQALADIQRGIEEAEKSELGYMRVFMLARLASVTATLGDLDGALKIVEQALARVDDDSGRVWEAELHRMQGELQLRQNPQARAQAESSLRRALGVAHAQQSHALELRAACSLANLVAGAGQTDEARVILESVLGVFSHSDNSADVVLARATLTRMQEYARKGAR